VRATLFVSIIVLTLLGSPAAAAVDPVVADVVRMLEEGVDAGVIADWLDSGAAKPGELGADDLIALTKAEAPQDLVTKILKLAGAAPEAVAEPAPPESAIPAPVLPPAAKTVVGFKIDYRPAIVEYQTLPWDLFVYLDGEPIARASGWASHTGSHLEQKFFEKELAPGRHVIRILQEQHTLKSKRKGRWSHNARVFPTAILFDIEQAGAWSVEIMVDEEGVLMPGRRKPVDWMITRDGDLVEQGVGLGPTTHRWPLLCEELETTLSDRQRNSRSGQRMLSECLTWDSLWMDLESVPDRTTVRGGMQQSNFKLAPGILTGVKLPLLWLGIGAEMTKKPAPKTIALPEPDRSGKVAFEKALASRRSVRRYSSTPPSLAQISQLLWAAQGITSRDGGRTAPSAGALYPLELYVVAAKVEELPKGIYKYRPRSHDLVHISEEDRRKEIAAAALDQSCVRTAPAIIAIAAVYDRVTGKYGDRGVMYTHMEVGLAGQNIYLQAETLELGTVMVGAFYEEKVGRLLQIPDEEVVLALMPFGRKR
jgi:SagB-type dehydrogenase family enzyme